ncbi:zinc finger BED domain-containing protein 4-like [Sitodiplosis mosellana]|uniref:zinc finger BED domain-containing protein 4-like n=1 Tax=Sitodiplosis mosellana TaxID=263140 RepID=UPI002444573F|nr:zinc finger BED domain-containing protein 4-like [Sitodiplosis mosellana]
MKGIKLSISKNSIKEHIKRSSDKIKQIIKEETKNKTVSLMIDIASRYNRSVLGVSISYVHNGKICIRTIGLRVLKASHTAVYIKDILIQILQEYGIRLAQVVSVTSDNGKNMVKAITILDAIYQAQKSESNRKQSDDFAEYDDEYYIDPDIFDDEYYDDLLTELERLMKLKPFCDTYELLSEAEWNTVQNIIAILAPFNKYSKKVQSETATLSDFFGYWTMLRIKVSKANDELSKNLLTQMDKYHHLLMKNPTLIAAVYLDPRFQRGVGENKDLAVVFLANLYAKIIEVEAYQDESNTVETIEEKNNEDGSYEELDQYLDACNSAYGVNRTSESSTPNEKEKITTILNDFFGKVQLPLTASVLDFWNEKKDTYPELYKLASVIMAMPPTQTIVERIFSALALVLTSHRTRIGDETLEDILVVRLNNNLLAKSHTEEEAIMRPDDLHFEQTE